MARKKYPKGQNPKSWKPPGWKPGYSHFSKALWEDPEHREKMKERDAALKRQRAEDPWSMASWGIPHGIGGKKAAIPLWRAAHKLADKYLDYMKRTDQAPSDMDVKVIDRPNIIPHTEMVVPESDEEKAVIALREAFLIAIGPTGVPDKLKAINTVLMYTRPKPESSTKLRVEKAEDFLDLIAEVKTEEPDDDDAEAD